MNLTIVGHPAQRMAERNITRDDIEHALSNCHASMPTKNRSIQYEGPGLNGRVLKVWLLLPGLVHDGSSMIVKSVAWKD